MFEKMVKRTLLTVIAVMVMMSVAVPAMAQVEGNPDTSISRDTVVRAWGLNLNGQLGDRTYTDRYKPVPVKAGLRPINKWQRWENLSGVKAIAAGDYHSLALKTDGTVRAWGANFEGQLGDLSTTVRKTPVQVNYLSDVKAIAAGSVHSLALKSNERVGAWGDNTYGQLGDGTTSDRHAPIVLTTLGNSKATAVKGISAGGNHSLAKVSEPVFAQ